MLSVDNSTRQGFFQEYHLSVKQFGSRLIGVQTVCKSYQQRALGDKENIQVHYKSYSTMQYFKSFFTFLYIIVLGIELMSPSMTFGFIALREDTELTCRKLFCEERLCIDKALCYPFWLCS